MKAFILAFMLLLLIQGPSTAELSIKKINGSLPTGAMKVLGSGSGVIVGRRHILTNRHVAQDNTGKPYGGFKIYMAPKFEKGMPAKVISFCNEYDLALLEMGEPLEEIATKTTILDGIPSLGLRVTAYGFPMGSQFGIGLTATGGQVSRHPVVTNESDSDEQIHIKNAVWHDAVLSSGNSGGPLFSESHVLVGVNFAKLSVEDKHALAIPGNIVAQFIRLSECADEVSIQSHEDKPLKTVNPRSMTVYVEVWGDSDSSAVVDSDGEQSISSVVEDLKVKIESRLPMLDDDTLSKALNGEPQLLISEQDASSIRAGTIARIKGKLTVFQVLDDGLLVEIDGVRCFIVLDQGSGAEIGAKFGQGVISGVPLDLAFVVGPATSYTTVVGTTKHAILLVPAMELFTKLEFKGLVEAEVSRRRAVLQEARQREQVLKRSKAEQRYLAKLRHTFSDSSEKFTVDAVVLSLREDSVEIMRMTDRKQMSVPLKKLREDDRRWLKSNRSLIKAYGEEFKKLHGMSDAK